MRWLRDHSLSLVLLAIFLAFRGWHYALAGDDFWEVFASGMSDDTWGALLIVLATKWWYERGSAASK